MRKKINLISSFIVMLCLMLCLCVSASAVEVEATGQCGDNAYWSFDESTGTLTISGSGKIDDAVLFDEETGSFVENEETGFLINMPWYHLKNQIKTIVIEEGITEIGACAFHSLFYLTKVEFPSTLEVVGCAAFCDCIRLEVLDFPDSVKTLYVSNYNEISIKKIVLPKSLESTPMFPGVDGLFDFNMCAYLESITVPEEIGSMEFTVDSSNPSIRNIYNYSSEAVVKFFDSDVWYGDEATAEYATVAIGAALASIEYGLSDEELEAFVLEKINEYYGEDYAEVPEPNLTDTVPDYITVYCYRNSAQHNYCVANNINFILIEEHAHLDTDRDGFCDVCGVIFIVDRGVCGAQGDNATWVLYGNGDLIISGTGAMADNITVFSKYDIKNIVIEDGITTIGSWAFSRCDRITDITIPESITSIGDGAFSSCNSLTNIVIPNSVTSIGAAAFFSCDNLISITIPEKVTSIGEVSFGDCKNLSSITLENSIVSIGKDAFDGCINLKDVYFRGIEKDWNNITIARGNEPLTDATIHFNACKHTADGFGTITKEENINEPTYLKDGSYDEVTICENCGAELDRETKEIPNLSLLDSVIEEIEDTFKGIYDAIAGWVTKFFKNIIKQWQNN